MQRIANALNFTNEGWRLIAVSVLIGTVASAALSGGSLAAIIGGGLGSFAVALGYAYSRG